MQFEKVAISEQKEFKTEEEKVDYLVRKIAEEKGKIITQSNAKVGIYNADNEFISTVLSNVRNDVKVLSFGKKKTNDLFFADYTVSTTGTNFSFGTPDKKTLTVAIANYLLPAEYQETVAAAILAARQTGLSYEQIKLSLEAHFSLPKSRATMFHGIHDSIIIDSSYNASRIAVEAMLGLVAQLKKQTKRPVVFLFGDMRELGKESHYEHAVVAKQFAGIVDYLYLVGQQTREYVLPEVQLHENQFKEIRWFHDARRAGEYLRDNLPKQAVVLVKGSQNTIFLEEAVKYLLSDKTDTTKLCRQENYWLKKKQALL
jgi:UDP-N-acetylmuramyl pentapeptide synthase